MEWKPPPHDFKRISQNVYFLTHSDHDRPAIGVIIGKEATMLVDAGNSNHHASVILDHIQKLKKERELPPIRYIVLTHWHWDHSFGLNGYEGAFLDQSYDIMSYPVIISHHLTRKQLELQQNYEFSEEALQKRIDDDLEIEFIRTHMKQEFPDLSSIDVRTPKLSYNDNLVVDLGGLLVEIDHIGGDHSADSSIIHVEDKAIDKDYAHWVLFIGDCLYPDIYNGWKYTIEKLERTIRKLENYPADTYIDAHDNPYNEFGFDILIGYFQVLIAYYKENHDILNSKNSSVSHDLLFRELSLKLFEDFEQSEFSSSDWRETFDFILKGLIAGDHRYNT